jgi:hypothetical protein
MLAPNTYVHDRYLVVRAIDGSVYEALDMTNRAQVALKLLAGGAREGAWPQIERAAQALKALRHPHLPAILDYFREGDDAVVVSAFVAGEALAAAVGPGRGLPFERLLGYTEQLLNALEYVHQHVPPVLHRSIKPQNVLLGADGNVALVGLWPALVPPQPPVARAAGALGSSLQFMPPEQVQGAALDQRSDIYALAATLYFLSTSVLPPLAGKRINARQRGQLDPLRPVRELAPHVPSAWRDGLMQALAIDPAQRPPTVGALRQVLGMAPRPVVPESQVPTLVSVPPQPVAVEAPSLPPTLPVTVEPPAPAAPPAPARTRPPWMLPALISAVGVLLLVVIVVLIILREREVDAPPVEVQNITEVAQPTAVPAAAPATAAPEALAAPVEDATSAPATSAAPTAVPAAVPAIDTIEPAAAQVGAQAVTFTLRGTGLDAIKTARLVSEAGPAINVAVLALSSEQATLTVPAQTTLPAGEAEYRLEVNGATGAAPALMLRDFIERKVVAGVLTEYAYTGRVVADASGATATMHTASDAASQATGVLHNGDEVVLLRTDVDGWYQARIAKSADAAQVGVSGWVERWLIDNQGAPPLPTAEPTAAPKRYVGRVYSAPTDGAVQCGTAFSSTIYGSVEDARGRGIAGARLRIRSADGKNVFNRTTARGGVFNVPGLGCTSWTVQLLSVPDASGGFTANTVTVTNLNGGQYTAAEVRFRLQP